MLMSTNSSFVSKNLPLDLQKIILRYDQTRAIRVEADFYGASDMVASHLNLKTAPRSFSSWSHGWGTAELKFKEQLAWDPNWKLNRLVRNTNIAHFLQEHGVENAIAVGLPIIYVPDGGIKRKPDSILFMPAHSLSYVDIDLNLETLILEAKRLKAKGYYVCFCIHSACITHGKTIPLLNQNNLDWFAGSSVNDVNSLQRMRNIFEYFDSIASNTIGSHFVYSQLFGAKFFFTEPYFEFHPDQFLKDPFLGSRPELREYLMLQSSAEFIKRKHPSYFNGNENAVCNQDFAATECGIPDKVSSEKLALLLGWDLKHQLLSPVPFFSSKLSSKLKKLIRGNFFN